MAKRFLKYETENPVGVNNEGCLEPISWDNLADKPFDAAVEKEYIMEPITLIAGESHPNIFLGINVNEECIVNVDGIEYPAIGGEGPSPAYCPMVKNHGINWLYISADDTYIRTTGDAPESAVVSVYTIKETIKPLDPKYIVLTSPNGTKYNLSVSDDGALSATAIS